MLATTMYDVVHRPFPMLVLYQIGDEGVRVLARLLTHARNFNLAHITATLRTKEEQMAKLIKESTTIRE